MAHKRNNILPFAPCHRLEVVGRKRSVDFALAGKVIPWPVRKSHVGADPPITNVQIVIDDQVYAEELRGLLEKDKKHRAYVVDRPSPTIGGLIVLDETTLHYLAVAEGTAALRYIVLHRGSSDPHK